LLFLLFFCIPFFSFSFELFIQLVCNFCTNKGGEQSLLWFLCITDLQLICNFLHTYMIRFHCKSSLWFLWLNGVRSLHIAVGGVYYSYSCQSLIFFFLMHALPGLKGICLPPFCT
jgi:hypothetical protein